VPSNSQITVRKLCERFSQFAVVEYIRFFHGAIQLFGTAEFSGWLSNGIPNWTTRMK